MNRERIALYGLMVLILAAFALTGYGYYVGQQTRTLLAQRTPPPTVARYAQIQAVLAKKHADSPSSPDITAPSTPLPEDTAAVTELVVGIEQAETTLTRFEQEITGNEAWTAIYERLFSRSVETWTPEEWAQLKTFLLEHAGLLDDIRAMANATGPVYALDFSEGYALLLPHLSNMRHMARLLQANAVALAREGNGEGATEDILAGLRLASRLDEEPLIISQLVRVAMHSIMYEGVAEAFPEGEIPSALLHEIADHVSRVDLPQLFTETWHMEASMGLNFMADVMGGSWQSGRDQLEEMLFPPRLPSEGGSRWATYLYVSPLARPWQHLDMQAFDRFMNAFEPALSMPYYEARPIVEALEVQIEALPPTRMFTQALHPSMMGVLNVVARQEAREQLLFLGAALESYADEHGAYPASLDDVQSASSDISLIDPFTGAPFHYRVDGDSFQLYSVGWNRTDEGGVHDFSSGDIVWRGRKSSDVPKSLVAQHTSG